MGTKFLKPSEGVPPITENPIIEQNNSPQPADKAEESNKDLKKSGARDLTDEELRILNDKMREGLEKVKNHPWNGKED